MTINKTPIEWCDYTVNPVKGLCPVACPYCYARRMYKRFKWNPEISFQSDAMDGCLDLPKGSRVFVGSTFELFGKWVKPEWLKSILAVASLCSDVSFIFLTKQPRGLPDKFPDNCWVGLSVDNMSRYGDITETFQRVSAKVKFVSFEPILDYTAPDLRYVDWIIIGQQTPVSDNSRPKPYQIQALISYADASNIPVFVKDNIIADLKLDAVNRNWNRQEFPQ